MKLRVLYKEGVRGHRNACDYNQGVLVGFIDIFYKFKRVVETKCVLRGDSCCEHLLEWEPVSFWRRARQQLFRRTELFREALDELERKDQENQDLIFTLEKRVKQRSEKIEQANRELQKVNQKLERLVEDGRQYLANASHELNNPLTAINGNIQLLLEGEGEDEARSREVLRLVRKDVRRLARLADNILTLSEANFGDWRGDFRQAAIDQAIEQAVKILKPMAQKKEIDLQYRAKESVVVYGSSDLLTQLVFNLVENAIKYTPEGGEVAVRLWTDRGKVRFCVKDNGPGVPVEYREKIFENFFRVEKLRSRAMGGSGLGLSICRQIARAHGGKVWLKEESGRGSQFLFEMPKLTSHRRDGFERERSGQRARSAEAVEG
jgi:signal transduction histidine kinase